MLKVDNKKAINKLAVSGIKSNIKKYMVLICAVILTTVLFSSLFTISGSLINEMQRSTMRQVGGSAHSGFKYMTPEEYDMIKDDKEIKEISFRILVGDLEGDVFLKLRNEVCYVEELDAKMCFIELEAGHFPVKEDEIMLSDVTLEALEVPAQVGEKINLDVNIDGDIVSQEFTLCGYYKGDKLNASQMALVSKVFQEKYAPERHVTWDQQEEVGYAGWINSDIVFKNSFQIEEKTQSLIERSGLRDNIDYGVNWAYMSESMDTGTIMFLGLLLVTFIIAGYLIIYNIFDLNIVSDIQEYGLLKTVGTTGKQLRKIVFRRANIVCLIGIPIGLIIGIGVGALCIPLIESNLTMSEADMGKIYINIWIILFAAVFSYLTVVISAVKPCFKASKVSPIETVKYTQKTDKNGKPKKKIVTVVLSLALSLVVLNTVVTIIKSFSMDGYISSVLLSDFSVQDATLDNMSASYTDTKAVTEEFLNGLEQCDGVEEIGNVYINVFYKGQEFSDENWEKLKSGLLADETVRKKIAEHNPFPDFDMDEYMNHLDEEKCLYGNTYGMGRLAVDKLKVIETIDGSDKIDWEKFNSGDYVLATRFEYEDDFHMNFFEPGDKVQIRSYDPKYEEWETVTAENGEEFEIQSYDNAPVKEYTVYAVVDIPIATIYRHFNMFECDFILTEEEFLKLNGDWNPMRTLVNVEDDKEASVEQWINDYIEASGTTLVYTSKESVMEEYKSFQNMIAIVGIVLAVLLGFIGIMNFANTIVTSIITRGRELAMLEAVGMTKKQQKNMMVKEGFTYFAWTTVISLIISTLLSVTVVRMCLAETAMFYWHFTLLPIVVVLPVLFVLIAIIPIAALHRLSKRSVVDRLREE